jgi:3-phenylpropionate/trans-cinnamate dioxygenase ferredoxin reductase subunit
MERTVIVGAGQAGIQVADSLRMGGYCGPVVVIGDETHLPYQRPPLSKDFITEDAEPHVLPLRAKKFFADNGIDLRLGQAVTAIDRRRRLVRLNNNEHLGFSTLVLATGSAPRSLAAAETGTVGVRTLRTLADACVLREALASTRSAVVIGGGFIGLEFAAAARKRGVEVTVLEGAQLPLRRAMSSQTSAFITEAHRQMGTIMHLGESLAAIATCEGAVREVVGTSGRRYPADLVLLGVGVRPRDDLARDAGLMVDDGIVVDEHLRTSDPAIFAVGDCARFPIDLGGPLHRLESVQNATGQGRHVAALILGEPPQPYIELPWFWSNQGPIRLQIAGLALPEDDTVVVGDPADGRFSAFRFRARRLVAVESINRPAEHMASRRVLRSTRLPTPEQVAEPGFDLRQHATHLAAS